MTHYCWKVNKRLVKGCDDALATVVKLFQLVKQCFYVVVDGWRRATTRCSPLFQRARCRVQSATDRISCDSALFVNGCALIIDFRSIYTFEFLTSLFSQINSKPLVFLSSTRSLGHDNWIGHENQLRKLTLFFSPSATHRRNLLLWVIVSSVNHRSPLSLSQLAFDVLILQNLPACIFTS